ncbi:phage tail tape measure protein [Tenacibaculum maritimum]|nr:phage tail tape measure protein [Tenacibaculum maritimum]
MADNDAALSAMGDNVNILSKTMGGDTVAATNVLTTAMNQFNVSLDDPIAASKIMGDMMNVMAAGAKEGSAELPEVQAALKQGGMAAKDANISFVETNAAIQLLDKSGKKGAEGGVALRNVLTTLSQGRFLPKTVREELQNAGVDISKLTDLSIPLTERLKGLKPVMSDSALITKMFGKENSASAKALLNGIELIEEYKSKMTDTNTAVEQATTVMGSYGERQKRTKAWINDVKISIFQTTQAFMPYVQNTMSAVTSLGQLAVSLNAIKSIYGAFKMELWSGIKMWWKKIFATEADTVATNRNSASMGIGGKIASWYKTKIFTINTQMALGAIASVIYSKAIGVVQKAMLKATFATRAFSIAIMSIPVIGWIIAAITAIVIGLKLLWDNSRRFREILFGVWEAGKAVFHNIGIVISRVYNIVIKPIVSAIWKRFKAVFSKIKKITKTVFNAIGSALQWVWSSVIQPVVNFISESFSYVFDKIISLATNSWEWLTSIFSGFFQFINTTIIDPIRTVFENIWAWITGLLDKVFQKFEGILKPIKTLWNAIFSSEGMSDIKVAYKEGEKKGGESYDKDHEKEKEEKKEKDDSHKSVFDVANANAVPTTKPIGGAAAKKTEKRGTSSGKNVASLNITKLVENLNIYNHNGTTMNKTQITKMVKEALLTATADFVAIN